MKIAGLKLTHDGSFAVAEDDKLLFCVELEKVSNNNRHTPFKNLKYLDQILQYYGLSREDIDQWIIDGWENDPEYMMEKNKIVLEEETLPVHFYHNYKDGKSESEYSEYHSKEFGDYISFSHVFDHLCASYCTSPFSEKNESSFVLCFDGGVKPLLYYYDFESEEFLFCKELLKFGGDIYTGIASRTETFAFSRRVVNGYHTFTQKYAGRVMAYIAMGQVQSEILTACEKVYDQLSDDNTIAGQWSQNRKFETELLQKIGNLYSDADLLASFHVFLQKKLVAELCEAAAGFPHACSHLCLAGGSFLNIKWNSAIRSSGLFDEIYVPPFVNDSGNAIGAVCAHNLVKKKCVHLKWNTYQGTPMIRESQTEHWEKQEASLENLAGLLAKGQPVLFLDGCSELGPRALGARSILADARSFSMKAMINRIKKREDYRPVAPICIEEDAPLYFEPGTRDRFMLFEHQVTEYGKEHAPAVVHLDNTARLQTVSKEDNPKIYALLKEYKKLTNEAVLCNTSANDYGKGFFPSVKAAQKWGQVDYIWSEGMLYKKVAEYTD